MFPLEAEQKIVEIQGIKIGGQIGENPIFMIGSIFYKAKTKKVLKDPRTGDIDKAASESLISQQEEISELTGLPCGYDTGGGAETPEALWKLIEYVASQTKNPILLGGANPDLRVPTCKMISDAGLSAQVIYNSIEPHAKEEELVAIKDANIKCAILLAFDSRYIWPKNKMELIQGKNDKEGLMKKAERAGLSNVLIDTATLDVPSLAINARTIYMIKDQLGFPAGCGAHNALHTWSKLAEFTGREPSVKPISNVMVNSSVQMMGADFILYGPIPRANSIFPMMAMNQSILTYNAMRLNKFRNVNRNSPLFKIF
ncbi:MAG: hypothetical protein ACTSRW_09545 [Candidatus Helarchaeota archaeon]